MSGGPEILLHVDRAHPETLAGQLRAGLRDAIRSGRLTAGTRLPATRVLAQDLGVSRGVVVEAYAQLAAEGFLVTRPGSATEVPVPRGSRQHTHHGCAGNGTARRGCGDPSLTCARPAQISPCFPVPTGPGR